MSGKQWFLPRALACGCVLTLALSAFAADPPDTKAPTEKEPPDPPGTTVYMANLRLQFDTLDLNKDGFLDKDELAKAFRGPTAKAYDYDPKAGTSSDPKTTAPKTTDPARDPKEPGKDPAVKDTKDPTAKDPTTKDPKSSGTGGDKKPDYSKYPDYNFLVQLDSDGDGQISRKEYMAWARDYAVQLKQQADQMQKLVQAQAKLANTKPNSAEYKKLQAELNKEQAAMKKVEAQVKSYEKHVEQIHSTSKPQPKK